MDGHWLPRGSDRWIRVHSIRDFGGFFFSFLFYLSNFLFKTLHSVFGRDLLFYLLARDLSDLLWENVRHLFTMAHCEMTISPPNFLWMVSLALHLRLPSTLSLGKSEDFLIYTPTKDK